MAETCSHGSCALTPAQHIKRRARAPTPDACAFLHTTLAVRWCLSPASILVFGLRSTSSLDALMATGDFSLEPYMEDDIGLVDGEVFQLMLRS